MATAQQIEPDFFEVTDGEKWYTAKRRADGTWFVTNHRGRLINQGSAVHRRVVAAIPT